MTRRSRAKGGVPDEVLDWYREHPGAPELVETDWGARFASGEARRKQVQEKERHDLFVEGEVVDAGERLWAEREDRLKVGMDERYIGTLLDNARLTGDERLLLWRFYGDRATLQDIADELEVSRQAVHQRIKRLRVRLAYGG